MKKKSVKVTALLLAGGLLLAGCQATPGSGSSSGKSSQSSGRQSLSNPLSQAYYPAVVQDDVYQLNESRGIVSSKTSQANMENMERDLYELAKNSYSTGDYSLQEGRAISKEDAAQWLAPESEEYPDGLNPANSAQTDPARFEPHYLNTILEYDLMKKKDDNNYEPAAIIIGLALNAEDTAGSDKDAKKVSIDQDTALQKGKEIAPKVVERIREKEEYKSVPIQVNLFYNAPPADLGGGAYIAQATSKSGRQLGEWSTFDRDYIVYGVDTPPNQEDAANFDRFRGGIAKFFPQLSGVSGIGCYDSGSLTGLKITINTQFDGYTETTALVQRAIADASSMFKKDCAIQMEVLGPSGTTAAMKREAGESRFQYDVF